MTDRLEVLIIEDSAPLRASLAAVLSDAGHAVTMAADGRAGLQLALADPPDVLVLDLGLPGMDGLRVCERLRAECDRHVPVLMLTARDTLQEKLTGFEVGADDYLVKPFANAELVARCAALSRRHRVGASHVVQVGSLCIDRRTGTATRAGHTLTLRRTSYRLLLLLAEASPRAVSRSELVRRLWEQEPPESDPLRTHLYLLRQELDKPFDVPMLQTVHEVGFRLVADT
jgi:DNA-binding response OmpR family regulator